MKRRGLKRETSYRKLSMKNWLAFAPKVISKGWCIWMSNQYALKNCYLDWSTPKLYDLWKLIFNLYLYLLWNVHQTFDI